MLLLVPSARAQSEPTLTNTADRATHGMEARIVQVRAITVRPERAAWRFVEDAAAPAVAFVAHTAPGMSRPNAVFDLAVWTASRADGAESPGDYAAVSRRVRFKPGDFAAAGNVWIARKEVALSIVDDGVVEGIETLDLKVRLGRSLGLPTRIRLRQADGSACTPTPCAVSVTIADSQVGSSLTITADRATYGMEVDNVVFTVTRTGMSDSEITAGVTLVQDDTYLPAGRLQWTIRIPPDQTTATHTIYGEFFTGGATRSGDLTAMLMPAPGIEVGDPITVRMVVLDPAITVRSERAAWRFVEDDAAPAVAFVARTAPGLPRPNTVFDVAISTASRRDGAESPGDYAAVSQMVRFEPVDFAAAGGEWEARKEVALSIVDDGEVEGDETLDLKLERSPGLPARIRLRQADGSACGPIPCAVPVTIADPQVGPALTITAERDTYGLGTDNVVFTLTRTGMSASEITGSVTLMQDDTYVPADSLQWTFQIPSEQTTATLTLSGTLFTGGAAQSGDLTATLEPGDGYTVGTPGLATVRMIVLDPAIVVQPEEASYRFVEDDAAAAVAFVARTAPGLPRPNAAFLVSISSEDRPDGATAPDDYASVARTVTFEPADFAAAGSEWEARKEVAVPIVDDGVVEGDEAFDLELGRSPGLPHRISIRHADGSFCPEGGCTVPVTIAANDGPALSRIEISPVPPEASDDHGPVYRMDDFIALSDGAVHGRGAPLTFTLNLATEVTVTGAPELVLDIYDRERRARYTGGSGTRQLTFTWTVAKGDNDPDGLEFRFLDLNGGTIRDGEGRDLLPETIAAQHFAQHRVRGGLHAMRLEVSGLAREGEPFEIRVIRDGGYDEVAVAIVGVTDSALPHIPQLYSPALNGPGVRQFDFHDGEPSEPGVRTSTRTVMPLGDGVADESRSLTVQLAITDAGIYLHMGHRIRAWYLAEEPLEVTVPVIDTGQPLAEAGLRVHETSVREAPGAKLVFRVTLSPRSEDPVTVEYRTGDDPANEPNAIAGEDYVATRGTLTFQPGEILKTVEVEVLADDHDDGFESMRLVLSNAQGARIDKAAAIGVIRNTGPIPQAWLARFGRTVADQVLDAVENRMRGAQQPGIEMTLAGQSVGGQGLAHASDAAAGPHVWLKGGEDPAWRNRVGLNSLASREAAPGDLLSGTSFAFTAEARGGDYVSLWGRGAVTRFDGREDNLTLDGEVASAMVGADWSRDAWTAGLIVSHSVAEGGYVGNSEGEVKATFTGLFPWGRLALSERTDAWGAAGYGRGELTVTPKKPGTDEDGATIRTDLDLRMAAAGLRGMLVEGGPDALTLTGKTDALIVQTASDAARGSDGGNLAAARASVTRLRLGLEGSRPIELGGSATLTPSVEIGVRHDGGDAETGFGIDMGVGIAWSVPKHGLEMELRGRGLLTHETKGFRESGLSGSLAWNPTLSSERGPRLTLTQSVGGTAAGGADALLARGTLAGLAANSGSGVDDNGELRGRRLEAKFGYGFVVNDDRFASIPEIGVGLSETGRDFSLSWRLARNKAGGPGALQLSAEARWHETDGGNGASGYGIGVRFSARW